MSYHPLDVAAFELVLVSMKKFTHFSSKSHPKVRSPTTQVRHKITFCPLRVSLSRLLPFSPLSSASSSPSRAPPPSPPRAHARASDRLFVRSAVRGATRRRRGARRTETETERVTSGIIVAQIAADGGDDALARRAELRGAE